MRDFSYITSFHYSNKFHLCITVLNICYFFYHESVYSDIFKNKILGKYVYVNFYRNNIEIKVLLKHNVNFSLYY